MAPLLLPIDGFADSSNDPCMSAAEAAKNAMIIRQSGASLADTLQMVLADERINEESKGFVKALFVAAYKEDLYMSEEYKRIAINKFSDQAYMGCLGE